MAKRNANDLEHGDTINLEDESIMQTAEFKRLVELDAELFGNDGNPVREPSEPDQ